jgi:catechol 2,3-dioxygenase-like lactoylglutathione lyase family enzyme
MQRRQGCQAVALSPGGLGAIGTFLNRNAERRLTMLGAGKMMGFVPTKDYERARAFYEGKLGFEFVSLDQYALVMRVGGHMVRIVKIGNFTPLQGTILGWQIKDIEAVAAWLRASGVATEKYPFVQDKDLGIWTTPNGDKVAWFKDPDGNVLSISQHVS